MNRRASSLAVVAHSFALAACAGSPTHGGTDTPSSQASAPVREVPHHRGAQAPVHGTPLADAPRIPVGDSPFDGPSDALVTIVEFGDVRDFFTARAESTLAEIRAHYGDDVRIVWKTHPHSMLDPNGARTADALMAAQAQGHFWPMFEWVIAHPGASTDAEFTTAARSAGLDLARYQHDVETHAQHAWTEADTHLAHALGGPDITPIFYVNGTRIIGAHAMERFAPLIDAALAAAHNASPREQAYAQAVEHPIADPEGTPVPGAGFSSVVDLTRRYRVPIEHAPVWGHADAPVTMVSFEDFECPACARVEPILAELKRRYPDDLRIVWRNLPLWVHPNAIPAAEAGLAVFSLGGDTAFWRFHDTLYGDAGHEGWLARAALDAAARPLGIDQHRYAAMLDAHETHAGVRDDLLLAAHFGIGATPGFFINGRMLTGVQPVERFARIIETARDEARALIAHGTPAVDVFNTLTAHGETQVAYLAIAPGSSPEHPEPRYVLAEPHDVPVRGPANARVTITWYGEFESLASARAAQILDHVATHRHDQVRIVWRDLPTAPRGLPIAEAAREVFAQQSNDGFWRFHATLMQNQRALTPADLERIAVAQHIDAARFHAALASHTHVAAIRADHDGLEDIALQLDAPAVFVDGRLINGPALTEENVEHAVDAALATAH